MIFNVQRWFLRKTDLDKLHNYRHTETGQEEISLLNIFSLAGNLLPIVIATGMSIILMDQSVFEKLDIIGIIKIINNGSLPLICYSIILSGLIFLLDKTKPEHTELRKKVLGIGILLLFFNISLYTLLTSLNSTIKEFGHIFLFSLSIFLFYNAVNIAYTMVLLQQKVVANFAGAINKARENVSNGKEASKLGSDIKFD